MQGTTLVVQWPRFGPYHVARLEAVDRYMTAQGGRLVALETAARDSVYGWEQETAASFERVQALPNQHLADVTPRQVFSAVYAVLDRIQPDGVAITSYSGYDAQAALMWCRRHQRVAILMSDSKADDKPRAGWMEELKRRIVQQFDAGVVAGSKSLAYYHALGLPKEGLFTPLDVVDNAFFAEPVSSTEAKWPGLEDPAPFFLVVARLLKVKNHPRMLEAYHAYRTRTETPWRLVIVGDGPEHDTLMHLQQKLGIQGITWAGFQQVDALPAYYQHAHALVHPALKDTWGLVVNEAMAAGTPVAVSMQAGCAADLVADGVNGIVFDAYDTDRLAEALRRLHEVTEAERTAWVERSKTIVSTCTPDTFAEAIGQAYQYGRSTSARGADRLVRSVFWALRTLGRSSEPRQDT
ncbi:MAG: glycosyltransferase family 4 protein [Rhodothermales bacterium]